MAHDEGFREISRTPKEKIPLLEGLIRIGYSLVEARCIIGLDLESGFVPSGKAEELYAKLRNHLRKED